MTTGLRERKKLATRTALHESALRLVAERGLDAVSIDDIADRADVSPRTFFNYFAAKDDAVLGLDPDSSARQVSAFLARPADETPVQALRAVAHAQAEEMATDTELWPLRLKVIESTPALLARLAAVFGEGERVLAEAIAQRTGTRAGADAFPTLLAGVSGVAMRTALHRWFASDFTAALPDLVDQAWDLMTAGLPAPRAT